MIKFFLSFFIIYPANGGLTIERSLTNKIRSIRLQTEVTEVPLWRQHTAKLFSLIGLLEYTVCLSWGFPLYAIFDAA